MSSKSIVLHIGAAKCGSSALQTALSGTPTIHRMDGTEINYAAFDVPNSSILDKESLDPTREVYGYKASPNAKVILSADLRKLKKEISQYPTDLIFSREAWLSQSSVWATLLKELDLNVHVVVYVRPKVLVLNSAWWQWGAWGGLRFERWIENHMENHLFGNLVQQWSEIEGVSELTVRPLPSDIVSDFYEHVLNASKPTDVILSNPSLPGPILRLFQRNKSLRPGPHRSGIDFILSDLIKMEDKTPWVLDKDVVHRVLDGSEKDNQLLMSFMDERSAQSVRDDPRWWSASAYEHKVVEKPGKRPIPRDKLEEMCVKMAKAIEELKRENLKMK